jgi:hypothetical protein
VIVKLSPGADLRLSIKAKGMPFDALTLHGAAKPQGERRLCRSLGWKKIAGVPRSSVTLLEGVHWVMSFRKKAGLLFGEGIYEMTVHRRAAHR